jgi:DNA mismatch repair protein MutL
VVRRLAMAAPGVGFMLRDLDSGQIRFRADAEAGDLFAALPGRLAAILGPGFADNAVPVAAAREGLALSGFAGLPAFAKGARSPSTCSSTAARCATSCCWARCARRMPI